MVADTTIGLGGMQCREETEYRRIYVRTWGDQSTYVLGGTISDFPENDIARGAEGRNSLRSTTAELLAESVPKISTFLTIETNHEC